MKTQREREMQRVGDQLSDTQKISPRSSTDGIKQKRGKRERERDSKRERKESSTRQSPLITRTELALEIILGPQLDQKENRKKRHAKEKENNDRFPVGQKDFDAKKRSSSLFR